MNERIILCVSAGPFLSPTVRCRVLMIMMMVTVDESKSDTVDRFDRQTENAVLWGADKLGEMA